MKTKNLIIVLMLLASVSIVPIASASILDDIGIKVKNAIQLLSVSTPSGVCAVDSVTGQPVYMTAIWYSNTAGEALSALRSGYSAGSGTCISLNWYTGYSTGIAARAIGYEDGTWQGQSSSYVQIPMVKIGGYPTPVPTVIITSVPTAAPTVTVAPTTVAPPTAPQKPVIIPPTISAIWNLISSWFISWLPASIVGGQSVSATVNQPYTTQISLDFATPNTNYNSGTYEAKFGEWFIVDSNKNILKESGWSSELTGSPWAVTATFTPTAPGTYYLAAIIDKQTYNYVNGQWTMAESVETKELQQITVNLPGVQKQAPSPISSIFGGLSSWFNAWFPWLKW